MTYGMTNRADDIIDVWDGYIRYRNIFFQDGQPFEPIARYRFAEVLGFIYDFGEGQRVIDKTTGAIAEVMFYQRNLNDVTIFVKNVTSGQGGGFRAGEEYRQNTQINMLPFAQGPDIDAFGRQGIYDVERPLGQIQAISLQYLPAGIGKLIVFDSLTNLEPVQNGDDFLKGEEYWLYRENEVAGIPREALPPSQFNLDWKQIFKIPIDRGGPPSNFIKPIF